VPLGGLARWSGSLELQAPLPFIGRPHAIFAFLDAGRVWIDDRRFLPQDAVSSLEDDVFAGTGGGLQFGTPVGPVRIALGYKLNPSPRDLRDPREVGDALLQGLPLESAPPRSGRRWQIHLSLGRSL
jgi:outer membrane protein assembly factor BamA